MSRTMVRLDEVPCDILAEPPAMTFCRFLLRASSRTLHLLVLHLGSASGPRAGALLGRVTTVFLFLDRDQRVAEFV